MEEEVRVEGELLKDVKFADDQGMMAETEKGLQTIMDALSKIEKESDMKKCIKISDESLQEWKQTRMW